MLFAFGIGCLIRLVPLIISFPYPIGYDTINYYLPNLYHFDSNWVRLVTEFPIYIATVNLSSSIFSVDVYYSFLTSNVVLYGFFSVTIYLLSNKILNQSLNISLAFTIFVIFQFGTLRISWDLFRDLFSIIMFNLFLLLIYYLEKNNTWNRFISILALVFISILTIFSDRMIGMLLIVISFILSFIYKQKYLFIINTVFVFSFLFYFLTFDRITFFSANVNFMEMLLNPLYEKNTFSKIDISVLFLSLYGILMPFFAYGFIKTKLKGSSLLIKVPLLLALFLSFTWVFIPNYGYLVPERWLLIYGIYMSLIAIHGFFLIIDSKLGLNYKKKRTGIVFLFLLVFVVNGFLFATVPYGFVFSLPSLFQENTGFVFPLSMLFNSLDIKDNPGMVKSIEWINSNTTKDSTIVGTKHWRGWFSLFLDPPRKYIFTESFVNSDDMVVSSSKNERLNFLISLEKNLTSYLCPQHLSGNNVNPNSPLGDTEPSVYFIDYEDKVYGGDNSSLSEMVYKSKKFVIYDLSSHYACNS